MITFLVVLGVIIHRAAQPETWTWLAGDKEAAAKLAQAKPAAARSPATKPAVQPEHVVPGPTDLDIEEQDAAAEEFLALTDGGLEQGVEEMPAYWRLFRWAEHQTTAQMTKRAAKDVVFNEFMRDPDAQRGKLFTLKLDIRRVLAYPAPENKAGIKTVYELWGVTTESRAWLYCVLTAHLPEGMPVGPKVYETATVTGYFYKQQGYYEGGAGPRDKPLRAPLLIGRVTWKPSELRAAQEQSDLLLLMTQLGQRIWIVTLLIAALLVALLGYWVYTGVKPRPLAVSESFDPSSTRKSATVRNWLANAEEDSGDAPLPDQAGAAPWNGDGRRLRDFTDFHDN